MKCPGQDSRFWQPGAIFETQCPQCGQAVEFFKDEASRKCKQCGHRFVNPKMDFGCASYCQFAEQCLGELTPELLAKREDLLKDRVAVEMKKYFKQDFKRIAHASKVARYAEELVKAEHGDPAVVLCAAYLRDIGATAARAGHPADDASGQDTTGPDVAREILTRLGARPEMIAEVCEIIAQHHRPGDIQTLNFKVVHDADSIASLEEESRQVTPDAQALEALVAGSLLTASGRVLAKNVLKF